MKKVLSRSSVLFTALLISNIFLIYRLFKVQSEVVLQRKTLIAFNQNNYQKINYKDYRFNYHIPDEYYFYLFILFPEYTCPTCVDRMIKNINNIFPVKDQSLIVGYLGNDINELVRKGIGRDIILIDQNSLFGNDEFNINNPVALMVSYKREVVNFCVEDIKDSSKSVNYLNEMKHFLNIKLDKNK